MVSRTPNGAVLSGPTAVPLQLNDIKLTPSAAEGEIMAQKKLLVTGATGATGGYTVERLLERGHAVWALAHREDDRGFERVADFYVARFVRFGAALPIAIAIGRACRG